jgi:hypothetical protein
MAEIKSMSTSSRSVSDLSKISVKTGRALRLGLFFLYHIATLSRSTAGEKKAMNRLRSG